MNDLVALLDSGQDPRLLRQALALPLGTSILGYAYDYHVDTLLLALFLGGVLAIHVGRGVLAGLTLAMAILPEELPVVLTLFLGLGAWRLAREKVLARSIPAVELLGATTVLSDPTKNPISYHALTLGYQ